jgi:hypothetical protein
MLKRWILTIAVDRRQANRDQDVQRLYLELSYKPQHYSVVTTSFNFLFFK